MDAIECGIVKLPRVPVADNIPGSDVPKFRNLWEHVGRRMPRKGRGKAAGLDPLSLPVELQTALQALYGHYEKQFELWQQAGIEVPPCFIVVCNNTSTSKLVYDKTHRYQTDARRCHVNWVILDSDWEAEFCRVAESHPRMRAYVKNQGLGPGSALPQRLRHPNLRPRLHRAPGRRARRPVAPRRRDQGLPGGRRQGKEGNDGDVLGAGREQHPRLRPVGVRGVHGGV